ncbi:hypothetical protein ACRRVB_04930 [Candidatus Cardinium hertigii]|uniref:hypothetical protein n=1 Tax=Candidatus Cardinium hertigii TaxID=247481 RepID=UPI003D7F11B8
MSRPPSLMASLTILLAFSIDFFVSIVVLAASLIFSRVLFSVFAMVLSSRP